MRKFVKVSAIIVAVILILPIALFCGLMAVYDEDDLYDDYYGY